MKTSLIVRPIDANGRIVIPKNYLVDILRVNEGEKASVEFFYTEDSIIIKRFRPSCVFCDNREDLIDYKGGKICPDCLNELKNV